MEGAGWSARRQRIDRDAAREVDRGRNVANYKNLPLHAGAALGRRGGCGRGSFATLFRGPGVFTLLNQALVGRIGEKM
jgi:hypothetical protein